MTPRTEEDSAVKDEYCIEFKNVLEAARRVEGIAHRTPVMTSSSFNRPVGRRLFFKVEALQRTGSFKFRGALNATLSELQNHDATSNASLSVVTHSSGNHAAALALAAKLASTSPQNIPVKATIVMPRNAPEIKQAAVRDFGGHVILVDNTNEAREDAADRIVQETPGASFVHPSEDPRVIAGQGTAGLEFVQQVREMAGQELDAIIIPVGGGGLASGNTVALRGLLGDKVKIILAEPATLDDAHRSFAAKKLLGHHPDHRLDSVADGLKTTLGPNTWPIVRDMVDDIVTVTEEEILRATKHVWERLKVCIEPSAGVGVAVAMGDEFNSRYPVEDGIKNVGVILCGGNVDVIKISKRMEEIGS